MNQLNVPMNFSKCFRQQCFLVLSSGVIVFLTIITSYRWLLQPNINIQELFVFIYLERYPFFLLYIKIKFSQLNVLLKFMLTTTIDLPQHKRVFEFWNNDSCVSDIHETYQSDTNIIKLKQIRELHLELIKCAKNINDAYGLHILMSISTSFILIVAVSYSQYYFMKSTDYDQHIFPLCSFFYWNFHNAFKILIVCYVCVSTATEVCYLNIFYLVNEMIIYTSFFLLHATNTGDILCEMHEPSTSMEFRQEVYNFTLQLVQNPLSFNACGFFDLNNRLIYGVIGGITTYLVILIQIGGIPIQIFYTNSTESNNY
ncbi:hypothetical protein M0804_011306 [Polistes exclamans]|nr:hypothetical protein M0804_011306 [Polistes exclamans]